MEIYESTPCLHVNNLSITLNHLHYPINLVFGMNFSAFSHKIVCIVGESGCGKSMTCLGICGLLPPGIKQTNGTILLNNRRIDTLSSNQMKTILGNELVMILQNPLSCFDPIISIEEHFKETITSHGNSYTRECKDKIILSLKEVGFENPESILSLYPFQMSGGMLQSVMIGFALYSNASLLIADEPTTDIDCTTQKEILKRFDLLRKRQKIAIVLVTHDIGVVKEIADYVLIMKKGIIVEQGDASLVLTNPQHEYTKELISTYNSLIVNYKKTSFFKYLSLSGIESCY